MPLRFISRIAITTIAGALALGGATAASAQEITIRYVSPNTESDPTQAATIWFMDEVTRKTEGRVEFDRYLGNSLVRDQDILDAIGDGTVEMGKVFTVSYPGQLPLWNMTNLPFTSPSPYVAINTIRDLTDEFPEFDAELERFNVAALGVITTGGTGIVSKKPINTIEDLRGFQVRARGVQAEAFTAAGASPVSIPWNDVYEALSRGVVDGSTNYVVTTRPIRHNEVSDYYIAAGLGQAVQIEMINRDFLDGLPEDVRTILVETMREAEDRYAEVVSELAVSEREALESDPNGRMEYFALSDEEITKWIEMSPDFFGKWAEQNASFGDTEAIVDSYREREQYYTERGRELDLVDMW